MDYLQNRMRRSVTVTLPVDPPVTVSLAALGTPGEDQVSITPGEALAAQEVAEVARGEISVAVDLSRPAFVRQGAVIQTAAGGDKKPGGKPGIVKE